MTMAKDIVVITGGSGFLGQHLIREIQELWADKVDEIRVIDKKPFRKILNYNESIPVKEFIADIVEEDEIDEPLTGATIVFHTAARQFEFGMYANRQKFMEDNFQATKQLVFSMVRHRIPYLIYTGDAFASLGYEDCAGLSEKSTTKSIDRRYWLLREYGESKYRSENWLCSKNGPKFVDGSSVKVIAIRPTLMYGEGENFFLPEVMRLCRKYGFMPHIAAGGVLDTTYAGNVAYMHLLAADMLKLHPDECNGEVVNCNECTTPSNFYTFLKPFVEASGYQLKELPLPYLPTLALLYLVQLFLKLIWLIFGSTSNFDLPNVSTLIYFCYHYLYVNSTKARLLLNYKPKYQPEDTMQRTLQWWKANCAHY
ncbi:Putative 3-beta hydroxysteroid dehydrogenase [Trichuris trichiura]|uniref:Putative 3-beta hydroxysteroid dehydrogenase n=1 Tax=Trichuris trichiura TaxID=36087 RepID=A0A077ZL91_TRITR|nr:Putative 3-beta hydroxysteroid dehydrogenase [Trichuris trichiura]